MLEWLPSINQQTKSVGKDVENGYACALFVGRQIGPATVKSSMENPQKIKCGTLLSLSNSTFGYTSEETRNTNLKAYMHLYVHYIVIYNSKGMEAIKVSLNR